MKKLTLLALFSFFAAITMRADVILQGDFNYADGPVTNTSGGAWILHSGSGIGSGAAFVNGDRLENASSSTSPGTPRQDDVHRNFPAAYTNGGPIAVYASFVLNCTNLPSAAGGYFAHFYTNSSQFYGRLWALSGTNLCLPNTFRLAIANGSGASTIYPVDLALNQDYQVVEEWDPASAWKAYLWINPISSSDTKVTGADAIVVGQTSPVQAYAFRQASGMGNWFGTISNLFVASTFSEAATNCLFTNAVAPTIVYQPPAVVSNFVGASFPVSAVAAGQGLGNLTYQWQYSTSPANTSPQNAQDVIVDVSGYDANVLNFINAQTYDSGYYTLIATTPYGLSVTSSITKVAITATPVPPSFVNGPVSQTVYRGTKVTFPVSVTSPGNVTFTWYSNNTDITASGNISYPDADSSTLELDNVKTNFSATYKVAVTNDYATAPNNGVISNAVLIVSNPPVVSIAYLRSLIDPTTFNTTATLTQPFETTGIITSYTNFTTGDTANYYLQDATAGIDIFVTFGSTFRPQLGDQVTFDGVLSTFNGATGGLELYADTNAYPYTSYTIVSSGNALPAARVIPFTVTNDYGYLYLNTNLMGSLVTITNVYFGTNAGTTIGTNANTLVTVTNASGLTFRLEFYSLDLDVTNQVLPAFAYSVTGNLIGYHPFVYLAVSKFSNIVTNPPPTIIPTASAGITGFSLQDNGNVVINATNGQTTGVYYLLESTNIAKPINQWTPVATNVVTTNGPGGAFTFNGTNVVTPNTGNQFYILSNTNSNHP